MQEGKFPSGSDDGHSKDGVQRERISEATEIGEPESVAVRSIQTEDYAKIERLIQRCILLVNAKDYPQAVVQRMLSTDPYQPKNKKDEREYFVAGNEDPKGVIGLAGNEIKTFFVDPTHQGKGVGRTLLEHVENLIRARGYTFAQLYASMSAKSFYESNGYVALREDWSDVDQEKMLRYYMKKKFQDAQSSSRDLI